MNIKTILRYLIVGTVLISLLTGILSNILYSRQEIIEDVETLHATSILWGFPFLYSMWSLFAVLTFFLWLLGALGLFFFKRWGKATYLVAVVVSFFLLMFSGYSIDSGIGMLLSGISSLAEGAVVFIILYPATANEIFAKHQQANQ